MSRQENNQRLVDILRHLVESNPDLRFSQLLEVYGFVRGTRPAKPEFCTVDWKNEFYTEPEEVIKRVEQRLYGGR